MGNSCLHLRALNVVAETVGHGIGRLHQQMLEVLRGAFESRGSGGDFGLGL